MAMAQIDPAIYDEILGAGGQISAMDPQIAQQQAISQRLRAAGATPQSRMSGRRAAAPNIMEYLGAMANNAVAGQRENQTTGMQTQQAQMRQQQVQKILAALLRQQQPQQGNDLYSMAPPSDSSTADSRGNY